MAVQRRQSQRQRSANGRSRTSVTGPAQFDGSCGICGRRCESKFALTFHVAHCRGQLFARPNTARVRCPWPGCSNRTAYTESRLAGHIRCHTGERPFLCVTHGSRIHRRFATKSNALAHVRTHHGKGDGPVLREVAVVKNRDGSYRESIVAGEDDLSDNVKIGKCIRILQQLENWIIRKRKCTETEAARQDLLDRVRRRCVYEEGRLKDAESAVGQITASLLANLAADGSSDFLNEVNEDDGLDVVDIMSEDDCHEEDDVDDFGAVELPNEVDDDGLDVVDIMSEDDCHEEDHVDDFGAVDLPKEVDDDDLDVVDIMFEDDCSDGVHEEDHVDDFGAVDLPKEIDDDGLDDGRRARTQCFDEE
ncbi:MAG: hypothetical protein SGCHY_002134 [Lobulomycetales sp.]